MGFEVNLNNNTFASLYSIMIIYDIWYQKDNKYEILNCVAKCFYTRIAIKAIFRKELI